MNKFRTAAMLAALLIAAPAMARNDHPNVNYSCGHSKSADDWHWVGVPAWALQMENARSLAAGEEPTAAWDPAWMHAFCDSRLHKVIWCPPAPDDEITVECKRYGQW